MTEPQSRIIIVGATSGIAEQCARIWVKQNNVELVLIGRNKEKLQEIANDLTVRNPQAKINIIEGQFFDPEAISLLVNTIATQGRIDQVLIAHGMLPDQQECQNNLSLLNETLVVNSVSPTLFAEAFVSHLEKNHHGSLAILGSVAGDRGRKSIYAYGATKALLEHYVRGLQHRFAKSKVNVLLVKPGPTDTAMTAHLRGGRVPLADASIVAQDIVTAMNQGKKIIYTPGKWRVIMAIIRYLPTFIFNKMDI